MIKLPQAGEGGGISALARESRVHFAPGAEQDVATRWQSFLSSLRRTSVLSWGIPPSRGEKDFKGGRVLQSTAGSVEGSLAAGNNKTIQVGENTWAALPSAGCAKVQE